MMSIHDVGVCSEHLCVFLNVICPLLFIEKTKEASILAPRPLQPGLYSSLPTPNLLPSPRGRLGLGAGGVQGAMVAAAMLQRQGEEERWLARQRRQRTEKEDRQGPASEFRPHTLEPGPEPHELHRDTQR